MQLEDLTWNSANDDSLYAIGFRRTLRAFQQRPESVSLHWNFQQMKKCYVNRFEIVVASFLFAVTLGQHASMGQNNPPDMAKNNYPIVKTDKAKLEDWRSRWEKNIIREVQNRYCDKELGEEIGWLISPFLKGFYYGFLATGEAKWVDILVDWTDAWIKRAVKEPDGYLGWPKVGAAGTPVDRLDDYYADSLLGEAMVLRPVLLMSNQIMSVPALKGLYGAKAESYIELSKQLYEKWDRRGAWRDTDGAGIISVVLPFGIDPNTRMWTDGYDKRNAPGNGHSHPNNKANLVASWLLSLFDATQDPKFRERAEKWFRLMKSRMKYDNDGTYEIWNYWQPAGSWDYNPFLIYLRRPKHWVGVHPNDGYYDIDVESIIVAYEHGLVFNQDDIGRLIATALAKKRYWTALVPYDAAIQKQFEDLHKPDGWAGVALTPWYLTLQSQIR